jgi:hypothetical protein
MAHIDSIFISTNFEEVDMENNPDKQLCRYEFFEIIVRIAKEKYVKSRNCRTLIEAIGKILSENIFKNSDFTIEGQKWRDDYLWTPLINSLYYNNMDSLRIIYSVNT